jgi:hypothetical protein
MGESSPNLVTLLSEKFGNVSFRCFLWSGLLFDLRIECMESFRRSRRNTFVLMSSNPVVYGM